MIDWNLVARVAGGGFGVAILVLVILLMVVWVVGLVVQKTGSKSKQNTAKG
ncbi:MAG: hypothetical protein U1D67_06390 [Dehalococcoidia bacterium]|nr:hypothetical protein [Dehalococcoidia bacterium]MDZ4246726.1 hypothetical protein [Dehalococcoidia bacterium]